MKYSQLVGSIMALLLIVACFLPWSFYASENWTITGMNTLGTNYGKPGIIHMFFAVSSVIFFSVQRLWSKRCNIFMCALNIAWTIRNYIILSTCSGGECPEKKIGFYIVILASFLMFVMACLPKIKLKED